MSGELIKHVRGVVVLNGIINHSFRSSVESGHALFWFSESRAEYTDLQGAWQIHQRFSIALFPILGCASDIGVCQRSLASPDKPLGFIRRIYTSNLIVFSPHTK